MLFLSLVLLDSCKVDLVGLLAGDLSAPSQVVLSLLLAHPLYLAHFFADLLHQIGPSNVCLGIGDYFRPLQDPINEGVNNSQSWCPLTTKMELIKLSLSLMD